MYSNGKGTIKESHCIGDIFEHLTSILKIKISLTLETTHSLELNRFICFYWKHPKICSYPHFDTYFNPCPSEAFSVTRPPNEGDLLHVGVSILKTLYPHLFYQCIVMGLLFLLMEREGTHSSSYDVLWRYNINPGKVYNRWMPYTQKLDKKQIFVLKL